MAPPATSGRPARKGGDRKSKSARAGRVEDGFPSFSQRWISIKGVLFSVPRFHRYIKNSTPKSRVTMGAAVYTAAVVYSKLFFRNFISSLTLLLFSLSMVD